MRACRAITDGFQLVRYPRLANRQRRHSTLGYLSPAMFELQSAA